MGVRGCRGGERRETSHPACTNRGQGVLRPAVTLVGGHGGPEGEDAGKGGSENVCETTDSASPKGTHHGWVSRAGAEF